MLFQSLATPLELFAKKEENPKVRIWVSDPSLICMVNIIAMKMTMFLTKSPSRMIRWSCILNWWCGYCDLYQTLFKIFPIERIFNKPLHICSNSDGSGSIVPEIKIILPDSSLPEVRKTKTPTTLLPDTSLNFIVPHGEIFESKIQVFQALDLRNKFHTIVCSDDCDKLLLL